jgi:hypothetical protein
MTTMTTAELADAATEGDRNAAIEFVLDCLADRDDERAQFLRGLTERILDDSTEVARWLGSWLLSCILEHDARFNAADDEATKLIAAGKIGRGITGQELRSRYGRG